MVVIFNPVVPAPVVLMVWARSTRRFRRPSGVRHARSVNGSGAYGGSVLRTSRTAWGQLPAKGLKGRVSHDTLALDAVITAFRAEKRVLKAPER